MSNAPWLVTTQNSTPITEPPSPSVRSTTPKPQGNFEALLAEQNAGMANAAVLAPRRNFVLAGRSPSDLLRMQSFNKVPTNVGGGSAAEAMEETFNARGSTLGLARSMGEGSHLQSIMGSSDMLTHSLARSGLGDFVHGQTKKRQTRKKKNSGLDDLKVTGIGMLSAQFESGKDGIAAIGYDGTGGTSYGKYQIASKVGTMQDFLKFLDSQAPDLATRLRKSGPANTGSRHGAMPDTWRAIASEQPERFTKLQESFATESHYKPALASIVKRTGLTEANLSPAMREVIWSTAIQHGPAGAAKIFARADGLSGSADDPNYERNMISNVYKIRATQFGSSTEAVRAAVQNRFKKEKVLALNMLGNSTDSRA